MGSQWKHQTREYPLGWLAEVGRQLDLILEILDGRILAKRARIRERTDDET